MGVLATLAEYDSDDGSEEERARAFRGYDGVIASVAVIAPSKKWSPSRGTALGVEIGWVSVGF